MWPPLVTPFRCLRRLPRVCRLMSLLIKTVLNWGVRFPSSRVSPLRSSSKPPPAMSIFVNLVSCRQPTLHTTHKNVFREVYIKLIPMLCILCTMCVMWPDLGVYVFMYASQGDYKSYLSRFVGFPAVGDCVRLGLNPRRHIFISSSAAWRELQRLWYKGSVRG